jgi:hypothetical protein
LLQTAKEVVHNQAKVYDHLYRVVGHTNRLLLLPSTEAEVFINFQCGISNLLCKEKIYQGPLLENLDGYKVD